MKKFKVNSCQLTEPKKWAPCGTLFELIDGNKMNIQKADMFSPEYRFDTKDEAGKFFRDYYLKQGYTEEIDK